MRQSLRSILVSLLAGGALGAAPIVHQQPLFVSGEGGYHGYRIPSVIATPRGTVLAFVEGRRNSFNDIGDVDTILVRSTDGGQTWSKPRVIADHGEDFIGNPCVLADRKTGTVWLMLNGNRGTLTRRDWETGDGWHTVWLSRSADDGITWSTPVEITGRIRGKRKEMTFYAAGPGVGLQLRSGRLAFPNYFRWMGSDRTSYANFIYSDDRGKTWTHGSPAGKLTNEGQAVELAGGTVMFNMRSYARKNCRAVAYSRDGGATWDVPMLDENLVEPTCQASIIRLTAGGKDGKGILLFSNPASTRRENFTVRLSYDEGKSWPASKRLHAGPAGYSCLVPLSGGMIGCLYESGGQRYYERLVFARFNLEWLTAGADGLR